MRLSLLLTTALLILLNSRASALTELLRPFPDVPENHTHYEAILFLQANRIVEGYPDGTFRPDSTINRAEFTKILVESISVPNVIETCLQNNPSLFKDVNAQEWFSKYVCTAKKFGMIYGNPDGTFRPANPLNFAEAATLIARNYGVVNEIPKPVTEWYRPFVEGLATRSAIPLSITNFAQPLTRGEMAEIIYRVKSGISPKPSHTFEKLAELSKKPYVPPISATTSASSSSIFPASASSNALSSPTPGLSSASDTSGNSSSAPSGSLFWSSAFSQNSSGM